MKKNIIAIIAIVAMLPACAWMKAHQAEIKSALNTTSTGLIILARSYRAIGSPGLPPNDRALFDGITSAVAQVQAQVNQPANPEMIDTGIPAVNSAIKKSLVAGEIVSQGDVSTLALAAAKVAPPNDPAP